MFYLKLERTINEDCFYTFVTCFTLTDLPKSQLSVDLRTDNAIKKRVMYRSVCLSTNKEECSCSQFCVCLIYIYICSVENKIY